MSIRIETLQQLQDPALLEQVLDRLRRTTRPRQFAYKKRCKALGDAPLLLTAPPGRKLKSTLLRQLRLGTPTYKGVVHREGQQLIFTFTQTVNPTQTARWIAKCMHDAKSPVPLKCIVIRFPYGTSEIQQGETDLTTSDDFDLPDIEQLPNVDDTLEELEELNSSNIVETPTLEGLLQKHTSSKKLRWLQETERQIGEYEKASNELTSTIENLETRLYALEVEIAELTQLLATESEPVSTAPNPWNELFEQCQQTNWSLDEIRDCIAESNLSTDPMLKELQFLSDDEEMKAFRIVRQHCLEAAQKWANASKSTEWKQAQRRHQSITQSYQQLCNELEQHQSKLEQTEREQELTLQKFSKRKLDVFQKLKSILLNDQTTDDSTLNVLNERIEQYLLSVEDQSSTE